MNRFLLGGLCAVLLLTGGVFLWQGMTGLDDPLAAVASPPPDAGLPVGDPDLVGAPPPTPPEATPQSREERRFNRYDRNRDNSVTRIEMLSTRTNAFRRLDRDGNNLLSFEEWAAATSQRFAGADRDRNGALTRTEFAATAPQRRAQPRCACPPAGRRAGPAASAADEGEE